MSAEDTVESILEKDGAILVRANKHKVWKLSNGAVFTQPATPGDRRSAMNQLSELRKALGIIREHKPAPAKVKLRKAPSKPRPVSFNPKPLAIMGEALEKSGLLEKCLREQLAGRQNEVDVVYGQLCDANARIRRMELERVNCPMCRIKSWWKAWRPK